VILKLPYGRGSVVADLRGLRCWELRPESPPHAVPVAALIDRALDQPVDGPPLAARARGAKRITILVPDATRRIPLPEILPRLIAALSRAGVREQAVTVLVACGTHPPADSETLAALVGPLPEGVRVLQHDACKPSLLVEVGRLVTGEPVRIHRDAAEADFLVIVSSVAHHYFAGFTGGPKLVFPGVAGYEEIQANHRKVLDFTVTPPRRHPGCEPGVLAGNPVAEEIATAASLRAPDFALLLVAGAKGHAAWAAGGTLEVAFPLACEQVRAWFEVTAGPFRRMVVSAGGFPSDHTLIQAHKALDAACRFAEPDAEVLFAAACDGGAGSPDMAPFLADPRPAAIIARLAARYVQYGHTTLRLVEKTARYRVAMVTDLDGELVARLGMSRVPDAQAVLDRWREEAPHEAVGVMPGAPVFPRRS
jgi:nickel-dependent lactate racemase